jgi:predicted negative regulator of RcsB-dependent stress response
MSTYQTEEEQVEAIKKWWKENGRSVVGGIVLGFAIIGGWQAWQGYQRTQGETASAWYDAMRQAVNVDDYDAAMEHGKRLIGEYGGTAYASFAALELAKLAYQRGEKSVARNHLRWVSESGPDASIKDLARLRLGQLLLDLNELPMLQNLLSTPPLPAFAGEFAALRGDMEVAKGNREAARDAYRDALARGVEDEALLRMKLVDVGGSPAAS